MHAKLIKSAAFVTLAVGLSACGARNDTYPSLAIRPIESGVGSAAPVTPPAPIRAAVSPARLASLKADAAAAHAAFQNGESRAASLVRAAAGQPFESNARAAALVALADLDTQRGKTATTLAALDSLVAEAAGALSPDPALVGAQAEVAATVARQDETIARLWKVMGS